MWPFSKKASIEKEIRMSIQKSVQEGTSFEQWIGEIKPLLQENNLYKEEIKRLKNGKEKVFLSNKEELRCLFQSCTRTLFAKIRYESQMLSDIEYLRYSAVMDQFTRPDHKKIHSIILPKTDPWWEINYPPNSFGCRCQVRSIGKDELERRGMKPTVERLQNIADKDWAYHPGKTDRLEEHISGWLKAQQAPL